ncbi:MAG: hypothetical protein M3552_17790 [Planctomycetota bacterium]|nr:hypothetical protein [Planctomycetaceae bacterium]MDQ3332473.1 hypothetical protein [Planctomycetota bacterium]
MSLASAVFVAAQAGLLIVAGLATLWWSEDLMKFLIHMIGEERTLGAGNVIRTEDGGTLLTNPGGMALWTLPFLFLGVVQLSAAGTLIWLRWCRSSSTGGSTF